MSVDSSVSDNNRGNDLELFVPDSDQSSEMDTSSSIVNLDYDELHVSETSCSSSMADCDEYSRNGMISLNSDAESVYVPESTSRSVDSSSSHDMRSSNDDDRDGINLDAENVCVPCSPDRSSSVDMGNSNDGSRGDLQSLASYAPSVHVPESTTRSSKSSGSNGNEEDENCPDVIEEICSSVENLPLDDRQENGANANIENYVDVHTKETIDSNLTADATATADNFDNEFFDDILLNSAWFAVNENMETNPTSPTNPSAVDRKPSTKRRDDETYCSIVRYIGRK